MARKEFIDKDHEVMDRYYLITEKLESVKRKSEIRSIVKELEELIKVDPQFLDSYNLAAQLYRGDLGNFEKANVLEENAYKIAVKTISDQKGNWPKELNWGYLENRHLMRAIYQWAVNLWFSGKTEKALNIFRKLLKSNLNDNLGARYMILAIRLGLKPDFTQKWESEFGIDAEKMDGWWNKNYRKFAEEFKNYEKYNVYR